MRVFLSIDDVPRIPSFDTSLQHHFLSFSFLPLVLTFPLFSLPFPSLFPSQFLIFYPSFHFHPSSLNQITTAALPHSLSCTIAASFDIHPSFSFALSLSSSPFTSLIDHYSFLLTLSIHLDNFFCTYPSTSYSPFLPVVHTTASTSPQDQQYFLFP